MNYLRYKMLHAVRKLKYKRVASGAVPLTLQNVISGNLLGYKVYGGSVQNGTPAVDNPVDIESVGDKTKNLFDFSKLVSPNDIANGKVLEAYKNGVKVQGNASSTPGTMDFANGWFRPGDRSDNVHCRVYAEAGTDIYISADVTLLQQYNNNSNIMRIYALGASNITSQSSAIRLILNKKTRVSQKITVNTTGEYYLVFTLCSNILLIENIMVSKSNDTEYEPYGYKIPVTVNNQTTNIYLDEPLRKIGNYADYVDYETQKVVRNVDVIDDTGTLPIAQSLQPLAVPTEEDINLPDVAVQNGTNIIDVDTTVTPSSVEVEYYSTVKE